MKKIDFNTSLSEIPKEVRLGRYARYCDEFCKVIESKISKDNLPYLETNFASLVIKDKVSFIRRKLEEFMTGSYTPMEYDSEKNMIIVNKIPRDKEANEKEVKDELMHEFLHASSSNVQDNIIYCGFSKYDMRTNIGIGDGINEGYTEYLLEKLFGIYIKDGYSFEKIMAVLIETIVGEKMLSLYFQCALDELVEIYSQYGNSKDTYEIISCIDDLSKYGTLKHTSCYKKEDLKEELEVSIGYLVESYICKLEKLTQRGEITEGQFYVLLQKYVQQIKKISKINYFLPQVQKKDIIVSSLLHSEATGLLRNLKRKYY